MKRWLRGRGREAEEWDERKKNQHKTLVTVFCLELSCYTSESKNWLLCNSSFWFSQVQFIYSSQTRRLFFKVVLCKHISSVTSSTLIVAYTGINFSSSGYSISHAETLNIITRKLEFPLYSKKRNWPSLMEWASANSLQPSSNQISSLIYWTHALESHRSLQCNNLGECRPL